MMILNQIKEFKCAKCHHRVECLGKSPEDVVRLLSREIDMCRYKYREDYLECGFKSSRRVFENTISRLTQKIELKKGVPTMIPHAKADAENEASEDEVAERVIDLTAAKDPEDYYDPADDASRWSVEFTPDIWDKGSSCTYYTTGEHLVRNGAIKMLGKDSEGQLDIEVPDPIRILVSKKGHVTELSSE